MPELTIDGERIEALPGRTVLQAALELGLEIPHYCYHPGLSIAGNCRMCLVELQGAPKLVIACATQAADGMVIDTANERVQRARAAVMEFLLINHPLDCTICDQAGECRLQEYAVEHGTGRSRYTDPKVALAKAVDVGEHIVLDQERCIQCSRCTRFCEEVSQTNELAFFQRGDRTIIGIYPGRRLDNPYSGNTVDLCPVGALTLKEFRFLTRVWYLRNTPSVCTACARGCNVLVATGMQNEMWTTRGQFDDRIKRLVPRVNEDVNRWWMCDEGRLSFRAMQAAERLKLPAAPLGGELEWDEAVRRAGETLRESAQAGRLGVVFSPRLLNETLFAWRQLLEGLGGARSGVVRLARGEDDELLIRRDKGGNSRGAAWILGQDADAERVLDAARRGELDTLVVLGDPLYPGDTAAIDDAVRGRLASLIYVGPFLDAAARQATLLLPACSWSEEDGSAVNFAGRVQWLRRAHRPRGEGRPGWRIVLDLAQAAGVELPAWERTDDVLRAVGRACEPFAGLTEQRLGLLGVAAGAGVGTGA